MGQSKRKFTILRWTIWSLAALFFFYEFLIRVMPSVMAKEIMHAFTIDGGTFGTLSAAYMFAYAPMQLPIGVLMDKYGARKLMTIGAALCGVGAILFGGSDSFFITQVGRFATGAGSAFAFVGLLYVTTHWFSGKSVALLIGLGNSLGMIGAICGQGPLSYAVNAFGWRATSIGIGCVGFLLAIAILVFVRNAPQGSAQEKEQVETFSELFKNLRKVVSNKTTWVIAFISFFSYVPTVAFAGLWAVPFIQDVYRVSTTEAGYIASMTFVGWILGGPVIGHFSDIYQRRKPFLIGCSFISLIFMSLIVYLPPITIAEIAILTIGLGIFLSSQLLTYSAIIEANPPEAKGSAIAIVNFMVFVGASVFQPLVGAALDFHWTIHKEGHTTEYMRSNFLFAFSIFVLAMVAFFVLTLFFKEKTRKQIVKDEAGS